MHYHVKNHIHLLLQVWLMPFIEHLPKICELYNTNEAQFWIRLWDPNDELRDEIMCVIIDGAHRRHVSMKLAIESMRSLWVRPTASVNELVNKHASVKFCVCFIMLLFSQQLFLTRLYG
jgi:hypothetical protein